MGQRLGAPGPENLASPVLRNAQIAANQLVFTCAAAAGSPNRVRDLTSDPINNSTFGTLSIRRRVTNNTGANVTRLRYRLVDLTTFSAPPGVADLRARTSPTVSLSDPCSAGTVTIEGTTLELPAQGSGGGFNSTFSVGSVSSGSPLAPGASVNVEFKFGVQQTGFFKVFFNVEALP